MKKTATTIILLLISLLSSASQLFLWQSDSEEKIKSMLKAEDISIHYSDSKIIIGSVVTSLPSGAIVLDEYAWQGPEKNYFILRYQPESKADYLTKIAKHARVLYQDDDFSIVRAADEDVANLFPAIHGGMIRITKEVIRTESESINYTPGTLSARDEIADLISQVDIDTLEAYVQHLQDFGTRNAYKAGSVAAQNWILEKFQSYGLAAELHDFTMPGGPASDNVIATLTGTTYPDEYVILGAHYDSRSNNGDNEPGADDNATGTAGILEAARLLSQHQFDRSIIFATWSGEEYGLYGSGAWAGEAADNGMNILGYFNIDMAGYLAPGEVIHTDIIAPTSANELRQFYKDVCTIYLPDFQTFNGALSGGDSDHTSFNNNGFQGIFPFEDSQNYSPYIHTANDLIGPSVNNFEQHRTFVQATIASVVSLADQLAHPENLAGIAGDGEIDLEWTGVEGADYYNIYRNMDSVPYTNTTFTYFQDTAVENGSSYTYYITAFYAGNGEESGASNLVTLIPMPPISLPFFDDFETGAPYWLMEGSWGLQSGTFYSSEYALTESPAGEYQANLNISNTLRALDFSGATSAQLSFWTKYNIEIGYDYMYLEVSTNGSDWDQIASFTGSLNNWMQQVFSLNNYLDQPQVIIRFRFESDVFVEEDGMFIDDLEVNVNGVGITELFVDNNLQLQPNPATNSVTVSFMLDETSYARLLLSDLKGQIFRSTADTKAEKGFHTYTLDISGIESGIYFIVLQTSDRSVTRKLIITD